MTTTNTLPVPTTAQAHGDIVATTVRRAALKVKRDGHTRYVVPTAFGPRVTFNDRDITHGMRGYRVHADLIEVVEG